jgi:hypothetical protein
VRLLNSTIIIVIVLGVILCVGGPILGSYVTKASEKAENEELDKAKNK